MADDTANRDDSTVRRVGALVAVDGRA